jgi:hypothetical protein
MGLIKRFSRPLLHGQLTIVKPHAKTNNFKGKSKRHARRHQKTLWATADKLRDTLPPRLITGQLRLPAI